MENILEVSNLSKDLGGFALDNVSFSIPKGTIMGLVGENGSGKTTTIKTLLNISKKDSGQVKIFGMDLDKEEVKIKEDIAVVFDDLNFQDSFNALDINKILMNIYKNWEEEVFFDYLEKFKLPEDKKIKDYSKGMRMKLSIAIALSHNAKLLILDEPTAGLDPVVRVEILDQLLDFIQNEDHGILFSTHITSDLDKIADYITLMHEGKIVFSMDRERLLSEYGLIKCGSEEFKDMDKSSIVGFTENKFGIEALTNNKNLIKQDYPDLVMDEVNIENIMFYHVKEVGK